MSLMHDVLFTGHFRKAVEKCPPPATASSSASPTRPDTARSTTYCEFVRILLKFYNTTRTYILVKTLDSYQVRQLLHGRADERVPGHDGRRSQRDGGRVGGGGAAAEHEHRRNRLGRRSPLRCVVRVPTGAL